MKVVYLFILLMLSTYSCTSQESTVTQLQENIYKFNDQYFYGERVHTYLIDLEDKVLLFDLPTYSDEVKNFITSFNKPAYAILSHGSCGIDDGPRWQKELGLKVYLHQGDTNHPWLDMTPDVYFTEMPDFDPTLQVIHTPGHSAGSICLLDKASKSLFSGDTFSGKKGGGIVDFTKKNQASYENLDDRISSCKELLDYDFFNVYPFHYEIISEDGKARLKTFLKDK